MTGPRHKFKSGQLGLLASGRSTLACLSLLTLIPGAHNLHLHTLSGGQNTTDLEDHREQDLALPWDIWESVSLENCPRNPSVPMHTQPPCSKVLPCSSPSA